MHFDKDYWERVITLPVDFGAVFRAKVHGEEYRIIVTASSNGAPYAARIAWCDQSQECREDLRQTSFPLTELDANMIDQPEGGEGVTHATLMNPRYKAIEHEWKVMK